MGDITTAVSIIEGILAAEREAGPVLSKNDWLAARVRRSAIAEMMNVVEKEHERLKKITQLERIADANVMAWADAVLKLPNLVFLEIDTTGVNKDDRITRFTLLDAAGEIVKDIIIDPGMRIFYNAAHASGLTDEMVAGKPAILEVWEEIVAALEGKYVVSYNMEFDTKMLRQEAERINMEPIYIVGACLMEKARLYYGRQDDRYNDGLRLEQVVRIMGGEMPEKPQQYATDRAQAQLCIVKAMSQGITDTSKKVSGTTLEDPFFDAELGDLDDHPF